MAINLFSDYGGFYNHYKVTDIPKVDVSEVKRQDDLKKQEEMLSFDSLNVQTEESAPVVADKPDLRSKMADLENISLTFNASEDFSYIGSDFEIGNLDIKQAISDMKKDKILEDYQFFVGSNSNDNQNALSNEDGKVFLKF